MGASLHLLLMNQWLNVQELQGQVEILLEIGPGGNTALQVQGSS